MVSQFQRAEGTCATGFNEAHEKIWQETKGFLKLACPCCQQDTIRIYCLQFGFARVSINNEYREVPRGSCSLWCHSCKNFDSWSGLLPFWWPKEDPLAALQQQGNIHDIEDYDAHWETIAQAIPWKA